MNRIEEAYCPADEVYYSENISAVFEINGEQVFLVKSYEDYLTLKRQVTETFRTRTMDRIGPLFKCTLDGSRGSVLVFHISDDDIRHNMYHGEQALEVSAIDAIC